MYHDLFIIYRVWPCEGMEGKVEKNSLWKHSTIHHEGKLEKKDLEMKVVERHRSPLTRQIHEGVELEMNKAEIVLNSKSEWKHAKIPRIVIEVGEEREEDCSSGMSRSTEVGRKEKRSRGLKLRRSEKNGKEKRTKNRWEGTDQD